MLTLIAHIIGQVLAPLAGRTFFRTVKRFPPAFALVTLMGQALGAFLMVECDARGDWRMAWFGVFCLMVYTGLLGLLIIKCWNGTWAVFCDYAASQFESAVSDRV